MHTTATRRASNRNVKRPVISEAKLRRIIRDELSRQVLMQEGILDVLKKPFQKLNDKAKVWVTQKSSELAKKATEAVNALKVPEDMKEFLTSVETQEGGVSLDELMTMVPGLSDAKSGLETLKTVDFTQMMESSKNESVTFESARLSYILAEEKYVQKLERKPINESIALGAVSAWYAFSKTVVTTLGLIVFLLEGGAKVSSLIGLKKVAHALEKVAHFVEKIEDWFLAKAIFPAPVQYAAYLAFTGVKKVATRSKEKVLTFKEFQSPENKETKENVIKGLKIALLCVVVVEALTHVVHALQEFFHDIYKSTTDIIHAGEHAGVESRGIAKLGAELGKAGEEVGKDLETLGGVIGTKKPA